MQTYKIEIGILELWLKMHIMDTFLFFFIYINVHCLKKYKNGKEETFKLLQFHYVYHLYQFIGTGLGQERD